MIPWRYIGTVAILTLIIAAPQISITCCSCASLSCSAAISDTERHLRSSHRLYPPRHAKPMQLIFGLGAACDLLHPPWLLSRAFAIHLIIDCTTWLPG